MLSALDQGLGQVVEDERICCNAKRCVKIHKCIYCLVLSEVVATLIAYPLMIALYCKEY